MMIEFDRIIQYSNCEKEKKFYINKIHIITVTENKAGTFICTTNGEYRVKGTAKEITELING